MLIVLIIVILFVLYNTYFPKIDGFCGEGSDWMVDYRPEEKGIYWWYNK